MAAPFQLSPVPGVRLGPRHSPAPSCSSFFQGTQRQALRHTLRVWRLRVWDAGNPSGSARTTSAPAPPGSVPGGEASLGCSSLGKVRGSGLDGPGWVGARWEERVGIRQGLGHPGLHTSFPGFQGPCPTGDPQAELSVGSWAEAAGAVPSALAGEGPTIPTCSQVAPARSSEAVGTCPRDGRAMLPATLWLYCLTKAPFPSSLTFAAASSWGLYPRGLPSHAPVGPRLRPSQHPLPSDLALVRSWGEA